jgi:hypothetical protein
MSTVMKLPVTFGLIGFVLIGAYCPARAVTVTSNDIINVSLNNLPSGNFPGLYVVLAFASTNPFGPDEELRARLFDGANAFLGQRRPCVYRKLDSAILVVKAAEDRL